MEGRTLHINTLIGACDPQHDQFTERFQKEVLVTVDLAVAQALDWDWSWASQVLLSYTGLTAYTNAVRKAAEKYETAMQPLRIADRKRRRVAGEAFDEVIEHTRHLERTPEDWNAAHQAYQTAFDAFEYDQELYDSTQREFAEVKARAFAENYIKEGDK